MFSQKTPVFSNSAFARSSLWAPLQTDEKKILAPCLVNHPHLHFNRSSFKFWEISNNPGTFSEFLQRSDAKILSRISPSRKMICTTMHAFPLKENLSSPALKMHSKCWTFYQIDLNSPWWGIGRGENWIWNQNWRPAGQPHSINLIKLNCVYMYISCLLHQRGSFDILWWRKTYFFFLLCQDQLGGQYIFYSKCNKFSFSIDIPCLACINYMSVWLQISPSSHQILASLWKIMYDGNCATQR